MDRHKRKVDKLKIKIDNLKRDYENHELELFETNQARLMHYRDSLAYQKLSVFLGIIIATLIIYIVTT